MEYACVEQIKGLRALVGMTRESFAKVTGIELNRIINLEKKNSRMFAEDVIKIAKKFPPFLGWMILDEDISMEVLKKSQLPLVKIACAQIELDNYPEIFEGKIK